MSLRVALHHESRYHYDRDVIIAPHEIRLRPAPNCRTPISAYSLTVKPEDHFINWQQDVFGNHIARVVFPAKKSRELVIAVDLVADMTVINPFDFFIEPYAENFPFAYPPELLRDLTPYLTLDEDGPLLKKWLADFRAAHPGTLSTIDFLIAVKIGRAHV